MLGSQRSHCHDKTNSGFVDSSEGVGRTGRSQVRLTGIGREYWTQWAQRSADSEVTVSEAQSQRVIGSNQKGGKMGAGYVNLQKQRKRQQRKVGREEEGSSSNRPELAAFVLALRGSLVTKPMLYLCDNPC